MINNEKIPSEITRDFDFILILTLGGKLCKQLVDPADGIEKLGDRLVVIESIDKKRDILTHINLGVPFATLDIVCAVGKVGGKDAVEHTFLIHLVELIKSVAEQTEGSEYEDALCSSFLEFA